MQNNSGQFSPATASVNCDPNIMCRQDKLFDARSVARFVYTVGPKRYFCTGTLLNDESSNGRAFFLVAFHCIDVGNASGLPFFPNGTIDPIESSALTSAAFQFQFWNTTCTGNIIPSGLAFLGAVVRAQWRGSDGVLLELTDPPGIGDGVNYAGWNRGTGNPSNTLSYIIHHPQAKDMRITTTKNVRTFLYNGQFWTAHYSNGTTDEGSSGAPLFNENDQVVGQLRSGWSNCNFTSFGDRYGKFSFTWNGGNLQPWLSPNQGLQSTSTLILSPFIIQGNDAICTGAQAQYKVPNLLSATYFWQVSANLQIISGQGTPTIVVKNPGGGGSGEFVVATINTPTKGYTRTLSVTKNIIANGSPNSLTGTYSTATNTFPLQTVNFVPSGSINAQFQWPSVTNISVTSSASGFSSAGNFFSFTISSGQSVSVNFNGIGACGPVNATRTFIQSGGFALVASPNPATSNINVMIMEVADTTVSTTKAQSLTTSNTTGITKMYLYNFNTGVLVKHWTYPEIQSTNYKLNIVDVKPGAYVLKMERNNKTTSTKIIVQ